MGKRKSLHGYELELRRMIKDRTGAACDPWLVPQVRAAAQNMMILDRVCEDLLAGDLVCLVTGSMGQQKQEVNPLLVQYDKMQRTLLLQLEALGLNFKTMPAKMTESTRKGLDEGDPMAALYQAAKGGGAPSVGHSPLHTPQSLRDSSPNLGEQPCPSNLEGEFSPGLGEQLHTPQSGQTPLMGHTPQSLRDSSPNLGEQPCPSELEGDFRHTPQSLRDSSPNLRAVPLGPPADADAARHGLRPRMARLGEEFLPSDLEGVQQLDKGEGV